MTDDYFIQHDTWGSAVLPRFTLTISFDTEDDFVRPLLIPRPVYEKTKHTCPLTEMKPGESLMYYCPTCSGVSC